MKKLLIAVGVVLTADILAGLFGLVSAEIAVAGYMGIVALTSTMLILTSRPAFAPVGHVPRRQMGTASEGVLVHAAAGVRPSYA